MSDLTVPELAALAGVPASTVRWHCRNERGQLHHAARRTPGGMYVIDAAAARQWAAAYQRRPSGRGRGEHTPR